MNANQSPAKPGARSGAFAFVAAFVRHAGWSGARAAALVAAGAVLEGLGLALLVPVIGLVLSPEQADGWFAAFGIAGDLRTRLSVLIAAFLGVMIVRALVLRWRDLALFELQSGFTIALRADVVGSLAAAPWERLVGIDHARISSLLMTDISRLATAGHFLIQIAVAGAMVAIQLVVAFSLAPLFALVAVTLLGGAGLVMRLAHRRTASMGQEIVRANHQLLGSAAGFLGGLKASAAQNASARFAGEFNAAQIGATAQQRQFTRAQANSRTIFGIGSALAGAAVVAGGVLAGLTPPILIALVVIFSRMAPLALQLQQASQNLIYNGGSYLAVRALQAELGAAKVGSTESVPPPAGAIELSDVTFRHGGTGRGISGASLTIRPGELIGVAGQSGGGKTTLIDLIAGLLHPQSGRITVGGQPLTGPALAGWGGQIGYVPQDAYLFHDSVRRNLCWGDPDVTDAQLLEALRIADADTLVARLPQGLDTVVGERGTLLSGGERQRLGIARAILRRPRLLILDEATAALDPGSEGEILARLAALQPRPAILLIAHRAETLDRCERVIRVADGRIVADQMTSISAL
ncbi:MAG: hypothetical protein CVT77_14690 [Alphaproteobacteria bacterium HGW-Alphaproteobacteria-16]|nr:MAG: hypothetical protein CVT77_14690 [Alphaproteobacteria bacterium HGW-Alphaproteobacteria-16]